MKDLGIQNVVEVAEQLGKTLRRSLSANRRQRDGWSRLVSCQYFRWRGAMSRTREQHRAQYALKFVKEYVRNQSQFFENKAKMHTHIQKASIQILQNGLGQMLAFLLADNEGKKDDRKSRPVSCMRILKNGSAATRSWIIPAGCIRMIQRRQNRKN